jgi:hypothetical protein
LSPVFADPLADFVAVADIAGTAMHPSVKKLTIKPGTKVKHAKTGERATVRASSIYHIVVTLKDGSRAHWARKWVQRTRS